MTGSAGLQYFKTMGTPLVSGREFAQQDQPDSEKVVVVNEAFARQLIPDIQNAGDAVGRRVSFDGEKGPYLKIVGVARDGKYFSITEQPRPFLWTPLSQDFSTNASLVVRSNVPPEGLISAVRQQVQSLDPSLPIYEAKTMSEHMRLSLFPARIAAGLLGAFGIVALTLAAIGIYGVTSYSVAQRTHEIGIRIALGAQLADVLRLIISQGLKLTAVAVGLGLIGAFILTRSMASLLYNVSATDPATFILVSVVLTATSLLACYIPARRATKVDPLVALRYE